MNEEEKLNGTPETQSISSKLSKYDRMDYCTELIRSVGIFLTIARLLIVVALIMLTSSSNIVMHSDKRVLSIGTAVNTIVLLVLTQQLFVGGMGLYGYSRLNAYTIAYFAMSALLFLLGSSIMQIILHSRSTERTRLKTDFERGPYFYDAAHKVDLFQINFNCCGTENVNYEQFTKLPLSCCPISEKPECTKDRMHKQLCQIKRPTFLTNTRQEYDGRSIMIFTVLPIIETLLSIYMVYRLDTQINIAA